MDALADKRLFAFQAVYIAVLLGLSAVRGIWLTPDVLFLLLVVVSIWKVQRRAFIREFGPFVLLLFSFHALRGLADNLGSSVRINYPIALDKAIFGEVPTVALQRWLFDPANQHWYDVVTAGFYVAHFALPVVAAYVIWRLRPEHYKPFILTLLVVSYAGFVTSVLLPTAPPWYAAQEGALSGVQLIHDEFPVISIPYATLGPNPVAAMPSLHAAYPWLYLMFAIRIWGCWKGTLFLPYVAGLYFSIIYLGHHYAVDAMAGLLYATVGYCLCATPLLGNVWRSVKARLSSESTYEGVPVPAEFEAGG